MKEPVGYDKLPHRGAGSAAGAGDLSAKPVLLRQRMPGRNSRQRKAVAALFSCGIEEVFMKRLFLSLIFSLCLAGTAFGAEFPIADPAELAGKNLGVATGSVQAIWAPEDFPDAQEVYCTNFADGTLALETGVIDALYGSDMPFRYIIAEKQDLTLLMTRDEEIRVASIFQKDAEGDLLRERFNEYLARMRESGTLARLEEKWLDGPEEIRRFDDPSEPPDVNGKLMISSQSGCTPLDYMKNGEMVGFEIEVVREFCREMGYQPVFYDTTFDGAIVGVNTGKYDMGAAGLMITEERARSVNFSEPMCVCRGALLVKKGTMQGRPGKAASGESASGETAGQPMAVLSEFDGKRIGVQPGTTQDVTITKTFRNPQVTYYTTFSDAVAALKTGLIDGYFGEDAMLRYAVGYTEDFTVLSAGDDDVAIAPVFQKTERGEKLRGQYNTFLEELRKNGRLEEITRKWFDGPEDVRCMDTSELPDVNGTVIIATEVGYAPFEYMKDGQLVGLEIELQREFCRKYGYRPTFMNTSFDAILMGVSTGKFDIGASGLSVTPERADTVSFGDPFAASHSAILVRSDGGWTGTDTGTAVLTGAESGSGAVREKTDLITSVRAGIHRTFIEEGRWKLFVSGIGVTFLITMLSVLFGTVAGFGLYLLCRNGNRAANTVVKAVAWLVSGMPLVVFLMVLFYVVFAKSGYSGTTVAIIGFTIVFALTMFHLMESGEKAVSPGQKEAAYALGYSDMSTFLRIILPQAARHFLPSYEGEVVSLMKATAVVGYITVMDITKISDVVRGRTYDALFPLLAVVAAYFLLAAIYRAAVRLVMKKVDTRNRPHEKIMKGVEIR